MSGSRFAVTLAIVATLVAGTAAFVTFESDPWRALARALRRGKYRAAAGRLVIIDTNPPPVLRAAATAAIEQPPDIAGKAYGVLASNADNHRKAVAALFVGKTVESERLMRAVPEHDRDAGYWNDLAVVLDSKGSSSNDETLLEALAAADRALDGGDSAELPARFNRAMIIDRLGLTALARSAYGAYLQGDSSTEWASEARHRLRTLEAARDEGTQWEHEIPALLRAGATGDLKRIADASATYPDYARRWAETEFLGDWADATSRGDRANAAALLTVSRVIGDTMRRTKGEALLAETVGAIDRASDDPANLVTLVSAHQRYREAKRLNDTRQTQAAAAEFEQARSLFDRGKSPMALMARLFSASAAVDVGDHTRAITMLDALNADAPADFHFLHAQMARLRATVLAFTGLPEAALSSQQEAHRELMAIGEVADAVEMTGRMAVALTNLGRPNEAWPIVRSSLAAAGAQGDSRVVQSVLHAAAFVALSEKRWELAHALLNLEIDGGGADTRLAEAAIWRVLAAERAGLTTVVSVELERARSAAASVADPNFREGAENEVRLTDALLTGAQWPERARALLTEYLVVTQRRGRRTRIPEVLVARAALSTRLERFDESERDLRRAVQMTEERRHRVDRDFLRDTFLGKSNETYAALADLLDRRGDSDAALDAADLPRARILLDREHATVQTGPLRARDVATLLPPRTVLVVFGFFAGRIVTYVITAKGLERITSTIPARDIEASIERFNQAIKTGDDVQAKNEGRWLYSALIAPARNTKADGDHLVIVDDPLFANLTFASLVQPGGRYLIEDATITVTPSIRAFVGARPRQGGHEPTLLSVGNPLIDSRQYSDLPPLHAAEREAREVFSLYKDATLLVSANATKRSIVAALPHVDVAHLGTHALSNSDDPEKSCLLLAPGDQNDGRLTMAEIAAMDLHHLDTVVAAGCQTATPGHAYGYVRSLSSAFLAAGARNIVASLWDVDDYAGREFSVAFHHALRTGADPADALRTVQLQMMRSPDHHINKLGAWSAMQLYGVGH